MAGDLALVSLFGHLASGGFHRLLIEPQGLDVGRAQDVAAARENPRHSGRRRRVGGGGRDGVAQIAEQTRPILRSRPGRMDVRRPILQMRRSVEFPLLDDLNGRGGVHDAISWLIFGAADGQCTTGDLVPG